MTDSYTILAKFYDEFISQDCGNGELPQSYRFSSYDCDYVCWSQYLLSKAALHNVKTVVDVACGTGKMTTLLVQGGLSVTATDKSAQMLSEAAGKCSATFVLQDMRKLQMLRKMDMATCVNDGVNYLKPAELSAFFRAVSSNLKPGAPFVFDVSSRYKLFNVLGNNVFYYDYDDATLLWTNKLGKNSVTMDLTLFEKHGETYKRFDESHVQYAHEQTDVERALIQAGFTVREVTSSYGKPLTPNSDRITFYAVKNKE